MPSPTSRDQSHRDTCLQCRQRFCDTLVLCCDLCTATRRDADGGRHHHHRNHHHGLVVDVVVSTNCYHDDRFCTITFFWHQSEATDNPPPNITPYVITHSLLLYVGRLGSGARLVGRIGSGVGDA